jgi:glycine cleavage system H protein
MDQERSKAKKEMLQYQRARFVTALPVDYLYAASHAWAARQGEGLWRVGLTRFATRMLGEMVDHGFAVEPEQAVERGQVIGWVEGFKAISDLFCVVAGEFAGANPALKERVHLVSRDPYRTGWLYEVKGESAADWMDVHAYAAFLDQTIDRILERQQAENK